MLEEVATVDIPGPPESDFRLPDGVQGVSLVVGADGAFGGRILFFEDVSESEVSAFVSEAIGYLGKDVVTVLGAGAAWPGCVVFEQLVAVGD